MSYRQVLWLMLLLAVFGIGLAPAAAQTNQPAIPAQTATATPASGVSALGSVEAATVVSVYFQTSGTVSAVYVELGDYVNAGDVLADLDTRDAWNTYNQAVLNQEKAQVTLNALYEPPSDQDLRTAKANVASAQAAYNATANSVSAADLQAAQLSYNRAEQNLQGLQQQRANMSGTDSEIALQEAKIGEASFNAQIARLQLQDKQTPDSAALWQASIKVQQAQLNLDKLQAGPTQAQIDSAQVALQTAQANVEDAQTALKHMQLIAPQSGTITALNLSARNSVAPTTAALEISDFSHLQITVPVNELDIPKVKIGATASIQLDALSGAAFPGQVEAISWLNKTNSDGIVTYDVQVSLATTDPRVRIGMTGEVLIDTGSAA